MTATGRGVTEEGRGGGAGRSERSQPAASHWTGMENSEKPQSRQTRMSGEGFMGG